jgi:hypothetical protein
VGIFGPAFVTATEPPPAITKHAMESQMIACLRQTALRCMHPSLLCRYAIVGTTKRCDIARLGTSEWKVGSTINRFNIRKTGQMA